MIQQDKYQNALHSLNSILTRARWMANQGSVTAVAELLDAAEILPKYIGQTDDATDEFRETVEDISRRFDHCSHIIEEFDRDCTCRW